MRENEFRKALSDSLARIGRGESVEASMAANPGQAAQLGGFLRAAATLRGMNAPQPTAQTMAKARNRLLERITAAGGGKETAVQGVLKFANLAVIAVATLLVASVGIVGANELGVISGPFGDDNSERFNARVVSVSDTLMFVQRDADHVFLRLNDDTRFEDESGHEIERTAVRRDSRIAVRATFDFWRLWDAHSITLLGEQTEPTPEATPLPEPTPAPTPEPTPVDTPQPAVETPKPEAVVTPKPTEKPVAPKPTEKPAAKEFWGIVTGVQGGGINVDSEVGAVFVHTNGETQYPEGHPFVGVKVWVLGTQQPDGTYIGIKISLKVAEFSGIVVGNGSPMIVKVDGHDKTVHWNGSTGFPTGHPNNGDTVAIRSFKMGDGSYTATEIKIKPPEAEYFTGVITEHNPGEFTIFVQVGSEIRSVCYENATVYGTLAVGKTVKVKVDHVEGGTYFAAPSGYVKVLD